MIDGNEREPKTSWWHNFREGFFHPLRTIRKASREQSQDVSSSDRRDFIVAAGLILSGLGLIIFPLAFDHSYAPVALMFGVAFIIGGVLVLIDKETAVDDKEADFVENDQSYRSRGNNWLEGGSLWLQRVLTYLLVIVFAVGMLILGVEWLSSDSRILWAFLHFGGAAFAYFAIGVLWLLLVNWHSKRQEPRLLSELSLTLGRRIRDIEAAEDDPDVHRLLSERYSRELFRNRISDLCGWVQSAWNWLGTIIVAVIFFGVLWMTVSEGTNNAQYVWFIIPVGLFFQLIAVVFGLLCYLFFGRYPGQARQVRKLLFAQKT